MTIAVLLHSGCKTDSTDVLLVASHGRWSWYYGRTVHHPSCKNLKLMVIFILLCVNFIMHWSAFMFSGGQCKQQWLKLLNCIHMKLHLMHPTALTCNFTAELAGQFCHIIKEIPSCTTLWTDNSFLVSLTPKGPVCLYFNSFIPL